MASWIVPTALGAIIALLAYFLKKDRDSIEDRLKLVEDLRDKILSVEQELYGAKGDNGHRQLLKDMEREMQYLAAVNHWIANVVVATADKAGVVIRSDRPKRTDFR
jgi:hypothetical protein